MSLFNLKRDSFVFSYVTPHAKKALDECLCQALFFDDINFLQEDYLLAENTSATSLIVIYARGSTVCTTVFIFPI